MAESDGSIKCQPIFVFFFIAPTSMKSRCMRMPIRDERKWIVANCVGLIAMLLYFVIQKPSCAFSCSSSAANMFYSISLTFDSILFLGIFHFCCAMSHDHDTKPATFDGWWDGFLFRFVFFSLFLFSRSFNEIQIQHTRISIFFFVGRFKDVVSQWIQTFGQSSLSLLFLSWLPATVRVHDYAKMVRM